MSGHRVVWATKPMVVPVPSVGRAHMVACDGSHMGVELVHVVAQNAWAPDLNDKGLGSSLGSTPRISSTIQGVVLSWRNESSPSMGSGTSKPAHASLRSGVSRALGWVALVVVVEPWFGCMCAHIGSKECVVSRTTCLGLYHLQGCKSAQANYKTEKRRTSCAHLIVVLVSLS
jgi:hypothetical protein